MVIIVLGSFSQRDPIILPFALLLFTIHYFSQLSKYSFLSNSQLSAETKILSAIIGKDQASAARTVYTILT